MNSELMAARQEIGRLRTSLSAQTRQTQETAQQKHDAVMETLRRLDAVGCQHPDSHPIEQVVGTSIAKLQAALSQKTAEHADVARRKKVKDSEIERLRNELSEEQAASGRREDELRLEIDRLTASLEATERNAAMEAQRHTAEEARLLAGWDAANEALDTSPSFCKLIAELQTWLDGTAKGASQLPGRVAPIENAVLCEVIKKLRELKAKYRGRRVVECRQCNGDGEIEVAE